MTKVILTLLITIFFAGSLWAADVADKNRVTFYSAIGGLGGGLTGAVCGYGVSYALDLNREQADRAGMLIGFPLGYAIGSYVGAKAQIDRLHFPDRISPGRVMMYSVAGGTVGYLWWRWTVKHYGYKKGFWQYWSIIPLAILGARIGTNNIYVPITYVRF